MSGDARFRDAGGGPLRLRAFDAEDLEVISALVQDAVAPVVEMGWNKRQRRFGILLNRIRREDVRLGPGRDVERVRSVLAFEDVTAIRLAGIDRTDTDLVLSLLSVTMEPADDGAGRITLTFAGDGAVELDVEALEAMLRDVTRPYAAPSGRMPDHGADG